MTWIKICGITNLEDAQAAVEAGADALGFVFYEKSPRRVNPEIARDIVRQLPAQVEKVGVFVDQSEDSICEVADRVGLTAVQMHGNNEDPHVGDLVVARRRDLKVLVAISMHGAKPEDWAMMWGPESVYAFLLDSGSPSKLGGTGMTFDWSAAKPSADVIGNLGRIIVAGGLVPQNVSDAIRILKPWGVDVSSGVEASPGNKDPEKVRAFIRAVREKSGSVDA
jgi:phosphoribosylanthranilate isomerase